METWFHGVPYSRGIRPSSVSELGDAPAASNKAAPSILLRCTHRYNGVQPTQFLAFGSAPFSIRVEHLAPGALGVKERKVFESPPEPRARMAVVRDSLSPVDAASAFASAAAQRASRRSGGRREPNTPLSRGMSEPERGV